MASFLDVCRFTPTLGGTTDWTVSTAVTGYQTPASAGAVNGAIYRYRAESADLSQWEVGYGAYTVSGTVLARTTVLFNSSGTTSKISFSTVPQVAIVGLAEDAAEYCGAGIFTTTSATQIKFAPYNGNRIKIQGSWYDIPSAGVTLANTGLVASTLHYAYVFMSSGTMTLELSTTGHATSTTAGNIGTEVKSGDESRSLVGILFTTSATPGQFTDTATARNVRSWFNRRSAAILSAILGANTALSASLAEVSTTLRTEFVAWANEVLTLNGGLFFFNNTVSAVLTTQFSLDGSVVGNPSIINGDGSSRVTPSGGLTYAASPAEGRHTISVFGSIASGTASLYVQTYYSASVEQ